VTWRRLAAATPAGVKTRRAAATSCHSPRRIAFWHGACCAALFMLLPSPGGVTTRCRAVRQAVGNAGGCETVASRWSATCLFPLPAVLPTFSLLPVHTLPSPTFTLFLPFHASSSCACCLPCLSYAHSSIAARRRTSVLSPAGGRRWALRRACCLSAATFSAFALLPCAANTRFRLLVRLRSRLSRCRQLRLCRAGGGADDA